MQQGLRNPFRKFQSKNYRANARYGSRSSESGYILLTLIFFVAVATIFWLALIPDFKQETKRDQEEEMRHRGTQYMRAIRAYYKKLGRYPSKIEDLESSNNIRFLRKRYKDPLMPAKDGEAQDFKFLHYGDNGVKLNGGLNGQTQPGGPPFLPDGNNGPANQPRNFGLNQNSIDPNPTQPDPNAIDSPQVPGDKSAGLDANGNKQANSGDANPDGTPKDATNASGPNANPNTPTFGGGAIVGVASISKADSIREFNHKHRYNQWLFYYDQQADRPGVLLNGPTQPQVLGFGATGQLPGQTNPTSLGSPITPNSGPDGSSGPGQNPPPIGDPPPN